MATIRSALLRLGRRSCGSSAAASMFGGRGLEVHQLFRPSAPSLPLFRPSARNLELQGLQRFSTSGMECTDQKKPLLVKHKAENVLRLWWQRSSDAVKNYRSSSSYDARVNRFIRVFGTIFSLALSWYYVVTFRALNSNNTRISGLRSRAKTEG